MKSITGKVRTFKIDFHAKRAESAFVCETGRMYINVAFFVFEKQKDNPAFARSYCLH